MAGYGIVKQAFAPDPHIRFFASTKTWVMGQDPASSLFYPHGNPQLMPDPTKATVRGTGPALFFARHLRKYLDRPIGVIGVATGRSLPKVWDPDLSDKGNKFNFGKMVEWVKLAGGYGNLKGMVWYQGESNAQHLRRIRRTTSRTSRSLSTGSGGTPATPTPRDRRTNLPRGGE